MRRKTRKSARELESVHCGESLKWKVEIELYASLSHCECQLSIDRQSLWQNQSNEEEEVFVFKLREGAAFVELELLPGRH